MQEVEGQLLRTRTRDKDIQVAPPLSRQIAKGWAELIILLPQNWFGAYGQATKQLWRTLKSKLQLVSLKAAI